MLTSILALLIMGLIVGALAKWLVPGREPGGIVVTAIIGVVGAILGGFLASEVVHRSGHLGFNLYTFVVGLVGSVILLVIYHAVNGGFRGRPYRRSSGSRSGYRSGYRSRYPRRRRRRLI